MCVNRLSYLRLWYVHAGRPCPFHVSVQLVVGGQPFAADIGLVLLDVGAQSARKDQAFHRGVNCLVNSLLRAVMLIVTAPSVAVN